MIFKYLILSCFVLIAGFSELQAQSLRSLNNSGVDKYRNKKFADAEVNFKKGLDKAPDNYITNFNLGDAYYQQKRYDEALKSYQTALAQAKTKSEKAEVYHNIGNSLLKSNQLKESIGAYKNSLKLNPNDEETKYNLSYALSMLKNQQNQKNKQNQNNNQQNKDQKNDQNQNKNQDQKNKDQQNKQQQNQNKQQNQQAQQDATKQKQQQNKISKQEAERILQALKNNEKELQKKLRKQKGVPVKTDKDW